MGRCEHPASLGPEVQAEAPFTGTHGMVGWGVFVAVLALVTSHAVAEPPKQSVSKWGLFETAFSNSRIYANPFTEVSLDAVFTAPSGQRMTTEGFYDGNGTWRLRFMPDELGVWRYEARFSDGAAGGSGAFRCNRGREHGPLRVSLKNPLWFEHADGTPFYVRAFHLWYAESLSPEVLDRTLRYLQNQHFNTIVGPHLLPPDRILWETGAGGKTDFRRFNLAEWRALDRVVAAMGRRGMVLIPFNLFGGTNGMPKIATRDAEDLFLRYWVARWSGYWNATFQPTSEWEEGFSEEHILRVGARLRELDAGRHVASVHSLKASSVTVQRAEWFSYHTVQDKLTDWNATKYTWFVGLHRRVPKPILAHECLWEGNLYQEDAGLDVDNMRKAAWTIALSGGQINYADEVVPPRRWQRRGDVGKTFSELGAATKPSGRLFPFLKVMGDLIQSLPYWRMSPVPEASSTGICLADEGQCYVAYSPSGDAVTLNLEKVTGTLTASWIDPRTGKVANRIKVTGGAKRTFVIPDANDWVLLARK